MKKLRKRRSITQRVVVTMQVKFDGKRAALAVCRKGNTVRLMVMVDSKGNKDSETHELEMAQGEALHTALHAIGVWAWGSENNR